MRNNPQNPPTINIWDLKFKVLVRLVPFTIHCGWENSRGVILAVWYPPPNTKSHCLTLWLIYEVVINCFRVSTLMRSFFTDTLVSLSIVLVDVSPLWWTDPVPKLWYRVIWCNDLLMDLISNVFFKLLSCLEAPGTIYKETKNNAPHSHVIYDIF